MFREHLAAIYHALNEPVPPEIYQPIDKHEVKGDRPPQSFIHPVINGVGDEQDWERAGRIEIGGARGTMHRSSNVQSLFYGVDHRNFYLRVDFKAGVKPGKDIPGELHLLWYYAGVTNHNSPAPIANLPDEAPLNYGFHHHLGINLVTDSVWLQESHDRGMWQIRASRAEAVCDRCLEVAVPWGDLHIEPDYTLEILAVFANHGEFHSFIPENQLICLQAP